jgi:hypothetical protein
VIGEFGEIDAGLGPVVELVVEPIVTRDAMVNA